MRGPKYSAPLLEVICGHPVLGADFTDPTLSPWSGSCGRTTSMEKVKRETDSFLLSASPPSEASITQILPPTPVDPPIDLVALTAMSKFNVVLGATNRSLLGGGGLPERSAGVVKCPPGLTIPRASRMFPSASDTASDISVIADTMNSFSSNSGLPHITHPGSYHGCQPLSSTVYSGLPSCPFHGTQKVHVTGHVVVKPL